MNRQFRQCNNLGQRLSASLFVVRFHDPRLFRYVSLWARSHFSFAFLVDLFRSSFYRRIFWSSENSTISRHIRLSSCWWFLTINSANKSQTIRNQMRPDNMDKMKERMIFKPKNTIVMWTYRWNLGEGDRKKNSIRNHRQKPNTNATPHRNEWNIAPDVDRNTSWYRNPKSSGWLGRLLTLKSQSQQVITWHFKHQLSISFVLTFCFIQSTIKQVADHLIRNVPLLMESFKCLSRENIVEQNHWLKTVFEINFVGNQKWHMYSE